MILIRRSRVHTLRAPAPSTSYISFALYQSNPWKEPQVMVEAYDGKTVRILDVAEAAELLCAGAE